ncbi:uncharacterized protein L969DRAFT_93679 [Mixia osmundae IAM 14324]|uniref:uncharacterized protein n=1 Tax=Mixia osmundae (strain CBS 9802 / IAM 14324 / JCM 22182 / KY 12970) TaxID=764103 RepID=UPI0004A557A8|nr:uncharacterized protein L969DRAFT_93679 [Mixia osmundae IAM 14324]KEI39839.1 hypothetical protein L969DRAFT_93679 [Mixia osmundae IAM 14324]
MALANATAIGNAAGTILDSILKANLGVTRANVSFFPDLTGCTYRPGIPKDYILGAPIDHAGGGRCYPFHLNGSVAYEGVFAHYGYNPSMTSACVFLTLFMLLTVIHVGLTIASKRAWLSVIAIGGFVECIGWHGRLLSAFDNGFSAASKKSFLTSTVCLTIAPVFFSAACYATLVLIVSQLSQYGHATPRYSPRSMTIFFCLADFLSLVCQAIGGALTSTAKTTSARDTGTHIFLAGIVFQLVMMLVFLALYLEFFYTYNRHVPRKVARLALGVLLASVAIVIRGLYRTVELSEGWTRGPMIHEPYFFVFDAAMMRGRSQAGNAASSITEQAASMRLFGLLACAVLAQASLFGSTPDLDVVASFGADNPFASTSGQANKITLTMTSHSKGSDLLVQSVHGSFREMSGKERVLRNTTKAVYKAALPSEQPVPIVYQFHSEFKPQDLNFQIYVTYIDKKTYVQKVPVGIVQITEPKGSWLDPQLLFLYLILMSGAAGAAYFAYNKYVSSSRKRKGKKKSADGKAKVPGAFGSAPSTPAKGGKPPAVDESWLPDHHRVSQPKQRKGQTATSDSEGQSDAGGKRKPRKGRCMLRRALNGPVKLRLSSHIVRSSVQSVSVAAPYAQRKPRAHRASFSNSARELAKKRKMPPKKAAAAERKALLGRPSNNLQIGIVGLPNVGKSSLFNVIAKCDLGKAANFPYPEEARVPVPDDRFDWLVQLYKPKSEIPAFLTCVDIAGLTAGASTGAGLGNAFLSHVRAVDGIFQVVRAFDDAEVIHVEGDVDPIRDMNVIQTELRLKDIEWVEKTLESKRKTFRGTGTASLADKAKKEEIDIIAKIHKTLTEDNRDVRKPLVDWNNKEIDVINHLQLLTAKPVIYLVNLSEKDYIRKKNKWLAKIKAWIDENNPGDLLIPFSVALEERLVVMNPAEQAEEEKKIGTTSAVGKIMKAGYDGLHLIRYFTCGPDEVRAWTIRQGTRAPQAAGVIHGDFEKNFVCGEIMLFDDLKELGSEGAVKAAGKVMQKGKPYEMQDANIAYWKAGA